MKTKSIVIMALSLIVLQSCMLTSAVGMIKWMFDSKNPKEKAQIEQILKDALPVSEPRTYYDEDNREQLVTEMIRQVTSHRNQDPEDARYHFFLYEETWSALSDGEPAIERKRLYNWTVATYQDWVRATQLAELKKQNSTSGSGRR